MAESGSKNLVNMALVLFRNDPALIPEMTSVNVITFSKEFITVTKYPFHARTHTLH
jgi:hypothetical protein